MKKSAKKTTKKPAPKKKTSKPAPASATALTTRDKQKLLKPHRDYPDLVAALIKAWAASSREVRMADMSPAKLRALFNAAQAADQREQAARTKLEEKLQPLSDRRLMAESAMWKAVLDVNAVARAVGRSNATVASRFEFLTKALTARREAAAKEEESQAKG